MQKTFSSFPEILFIDGTYKLLRCGMTLVILLIEDGNGFSEVVGFGLLLTEDNDSYDWLLSTFKNLNVEASGNVKVVMCDKDSKERAAITKFFPNATLHICRFHTLDIFKRNLQKKNLTKETRAECYGLLQSLVYSHSEEQYIEIYNEFCQVAPAIVVDYFNTYWHQIRLEWTDYGMVSENLGNLTNNRLESINGKIKSMVKKMNSLIDFLEKLYLTVVFKCFRARL